MNMEERCTIEQSRKLVELGFILDTDGYWSKTLSTVKTPGEWVIAGKQETLDQGIDPHIWTNAYIPAPSIDELFEFIISR